MKTDLTSDTDKIHITRMGEQRIRRNLNLTDSDVVSWCKEAIKTADVIFGQGKNWYAYKDGIAITVNAKSCTVITAHKIRGSVRVMRESDYPCLNEFLYQSIFVPEGAKPPERDIIYEPEIFVYIDGFGKQTGDFGVVAEQNGQVIGSAWTRIIPAFGHIDNDTPELVISLLPEFRGCGIGTRLMQKLFKLLTENGYTQTSLSVQKGNPAVKFYERLGYKIIGDKPDHAGHADYIMVKELKSKERKDMIDRLNRAVTPTKDELVDYVGAANRTLLKDICAYIETGYNAKVQIDYSGCSGEPGWNFKYKKSGRSLCTVYPGRHNFIVLITLNAAGSGLFEALSENFSPYTQKLFKSAGGINDTKWLMIEVSSAQIAEDVKKLLELKFGR